MSSVEPVYIDLGPVAGKDAHILPPLADYINNGGEPGIEIISTEVETEEGEPQQVQLLFNFFNLVNDSLSSVQIEAISNDEVVNSSNTLNGTGATTLWQRIKAKFAAKTHKHSASDINSGTLDSARIGSKSIGTAKIADKAVGTSQIADNAVGSEQLSQSVRDSLSQSQIITKRKVVQIEMVTGKSAPITADQIEGFDFACWLQPASSGWVASIYTQEPTNSNTNVWVSSTTTDYQNQYGSVVISALYKKQ